MPNWYMRVAMPAVIGLLAVAMLAMGLRALITRRPYLFSARWMLAFVLLGYLPLAVGPLLMSVGHDHGGSGALRLVVWLQPVMFVVIAVVFALIMRGYVVIGITEASMREALFASLAELKLPHEETLGAIRLPSVPAELQVAVQSWVGTGQLKPRTRASSAVTASIAAGMNAHFRAGTTAVNMTCPIAYVVMAVLLGAMDVALVLAR